MHKVELDPTVYWRARGATKKWLIDVVGILPHWAVTAWSEFPSIKEGMEELYGFGRLYEMTGGEVDEEYVYRFPEDPPYHPQMVLKLGDEDVVVIWPYSIVGIYEDSKWFITRMD